MRRVIRCLHGPAHGPQAQLHLGVGPPSAMRSAPRRTSTPEPDSPFPSPDERQVGSLKVRLKRISEIVW